MNDNEPTSPPEIADTSTHEPAAENETRRRRRRLLLLYGIPAGIAVLVALLVLVAPPYIARYFANRYFVGAGIDVAGVKTVDIDLLDGKVSVGPVAFHSGTADPGSIGKLGVDIDVGNLFKKQALVQSLILEDVEIAVRQQEDGQIAINGIPLRQTLEEEAAAPKEPPAEEKAQGSTWGTGVDEVSIRNARLVFTNKAGGVAAMHVDRLDLHGFRSWEPDKPGTFNLTGTVNDIEISATGQARPFADKISVTAEISVDGVNLPRIEQYTGPLGPVSQSGTMTLYAYTSVAVATDGVVSGDLDGTLVLAQVDVSQPNQGSVQIDQGSVATNVRFSLDPLGAAKVAGTAKATINKAAAKASDGAAVTVSFADLELGDLAVDRTAEGVLTASTTPRLDVEAPAVSGTAEAHVEKIVFTTPQVHIIQNPERIELKVDAAADGKSASRLELQHPTVTQPIDASADLVALDLAPLSLSAAGNGGVTGQTTATLTLQSGRMTLPAAGGAAPMTVELTQIETALRNAELTAQGEKAQIKAQLSVKSGSIVAANDKQRFDLATLGVDLPATVVEKDAGGLVASTGGSVEVAQPAANLGGDQPLRAGSDSVRLDLEKIKLASGQDGRLSAAGKARLALEKPTAGLGTATEASAPAPVRTTPTRRGRPVAGSRGRTQTVAVAITGPAVSADEITLALSPFDVRMAGPELTVSGTSASTEIAGLKGAMPALAGQPATELSVGKFKLDLRNVDAQSREQAARLKGALEMLVDNVAASQTAEGRSTLQAQQVRLTLNELSADKAGNRLTLSTSGSSELRTLAAQLPKQGIKPQVEATLQSIQSRFDDVRFEQAGDQQRWSANTDALIGPLQAVAAEGQVLKAKINGISVQGLSVNQAMAIAIQQLTIDHPDVFISRQGINLFAQPQQTRVEEAAVKVEEVAKEQGATIHIGLFSVMNGGILQIRDATVQPQANFVVDLDTLQIGDLNTADPAQRTTVLMKGTINKFTGVEVAGWATPGSKQMDFDVNARLRRLELPPLSPYAASAIGLNIESGQLGIEATASASLGALKGDINVILRDLDFSTLSPEEAQRLSASVGAPVETVVGLLQDDEGVIRLNLPLSGDLASPSFSLGDAIGQAVTGAVKAAALAPFKLAFLPVTLLAEAASGSGLTFEPIPFAPGSAELAGKGETMTDALGKVLQDKGKLRVRVCGQSTGEDLRALIHEEGLGSTPPEKAIEQLRPKLEALASARTAAVRGALADAGAKPRQLSECRSTFDAADPKPPRADITL